MKLTILFCCLFLSVLCENEANKKALIRKSFQASIGNLTMLHQQAIDTEFYYKVFETCFKGATIVTAAGIGLAGFAALPAMVGVGAVALPALFTAPQLYSGILVGMTGSFGVKYYADKANTAILKKVNVNLDHLVFDIKRIYNFDEEKYKFILGNISESRQHLIKDDSISLKSEHLETAIKALLATVPSLGGLLVDKWSSVENAKEYIANLVDLISKNKEMLNTILSETEQGFMFIIAILESYNLYSILKYESDFPGYIKQMSDFLQGISDKLSDYI
jgi:hypothetical protein